MSLTGVTVGLHPLRCGDVLGVLDFAGPPEPAISCGPRMACTGQDLAFTAILPRYKLQESCSLHPLLIQGDEQRRHSPSGVKASALATEPGEPTSSSTSR